MKEYPNFYKLTKLTFNPIQDASGLLIAHQNLYCQTQWTIDQHSYIWNLAILKLLLEIQPKFFFRWMCMNRKDLFLVFHNLQPNFFLLPYVMPHNALYGVNGRRARLYQRWRVEQLREIKFGIFDHGNH